MQPKKGRDSMLDILFFSSLIYVSLHHIWACQFRDQRNGWAKDSISFFKTQNFLEVLLVICIFQSTLLIFLGYKDIEETKIICTTLPNPFGAVRQG